MKLETQTVWLAQDFESFHPLGELLKHNLDLQSGEVSPEANVSADAEGENVGLIPSDVKDERGY